ncbi:MAG: hypothetical protein Ct9H300mP11_14140 [Chloroflexota bacterium]|nr:MAG: hypothetical protein Ct9H300mP11_14140 [Chloroflexota bacterium]
MVPGMTCSIMPLGEVETSALTNLFATQALAAGGISVALFPIGPNIANSKIRNAISHLWPIAQKQKQIPPARFKPLTPSRRRTTLIGD